MPRLIVRTFSISIDGFGAGPDQDLDHPLGVGEEELHDWFLNTRTWRSQHGEPGGQTGTDEEFAARGFERLGAWILGRNMFGPIRGPWPDEEWHGWWGEEPPYHVPVFVLTHHERRPLAMKGGTEFRFVTTGIEDALEQADEAAGDQDNSPSVAAWLPSGSTCAPVWSMNCTSRSHRCCSAAASTC